MAVAAIQVQQRQIAALEHEVRGLRSEIADTQSTLMCSE
jgi:hypothetical protein